MQIILVVVGGRGTTLFQGAEDVMICAGRC